MNNTDPEQQNTKEKTQRKTFKDFSNKYLQNLLFFSSQKLSKLGYGKQKIEQAEIYLNENISQEMQQQTDNTLRAQINAQLTKLPFLISGILLLANQYKPNRVVRMQIIYIRTFFFCSTFLYVYRSFKYQQNRLKLLQNVFDQQKDYIDNKYNGNVQLQNQEYNLFETQNNGMNNLEFVDNINNSENQQDFGFENQNEQNEQFGYEYNKNNHNNRNNRNNEEQQIRNF